MLFLQKKKRRELCWTPFLKFEPCVILVNEVMEENIDSKNSFP